MSSDSKYSLLSIVEPKFPSSRYFVVWPLFTGKHIEPYSINGCGLTILKVSSNSYSKQLGSKNLIMLKRIQSFVVKLNFNSIHIMCENSRTIHWVLCKIQLILFERVKIVGHKNWNLFSNMFMEKGYPLEAKTTVRTESALCASLASQRQDQLVMANSASSVTL